MKMVTQVKGYTVQSLTNKYMLIKLNVNQTAMELTQSLWDDDFQHEDMDNTWSKSRILQETYLASKLPSS